MSENNKKTRKMTIVLPDETIGNLKSLAEEKGVTMSTIATISIEYFNWFYNQKKDGFTIKAQKYVDGKIVEKEIAII